MKFFALFLSPSDSLFMREFDNLIELDKFASLNKEDQLVRIIKGERIA